MPFANPEDRRAYVAKWQTEKRERLRQEMRDLLGGVCVDCGTDQNLEFDHIDPKTKVFQISNGILKAKEVLIKEVKKCVLRCDPCHNKRSKEQANVEHGGGMYGRKGCKCDLCRLKRNEYMRNWKQARKMDVRPSGKGNWLSAR